MLRARRSGRGGAKMRHSWLFVCFGERQEMYGVELFMRRYGLRLLTRV